MIKKIINHKTKLIREYIVTDAVKINNIWTDRFYCPKCHYNQVKQIMTKCPHCQVNLVWIEDLEDFYEKF